MNASVVRITNICIQNFKNVINGSLSLKNARKDYKASVIGIYGQNGSGKTSVVEALDLLKIVLCGRPVPLEFADYINADSDEATLSFEFSILLEEEPQTVIYQFSIRSVQDAIQNTVELNHGERKVVIFNELLKCPILSDRQTKIGRLMDTSCEDSFSPVAKRHLLIGNSRETATNSLVAKKLAEASSRSFIFSKELLEIIRKNVEVHRAEGNFDNDLKFYFSIIESLVNYGNTSLFVVRTSHTGVISLNAQPLMFKISEGSLDYQGIIMLPLGSPVEIREKEKNVVEKIIYNMNIVLTQLIPGLTVGVKDLGSLLLPDGERGNRIQFMSNRGAKEIPLKYESEGIKKIISILQLLIVVYNKSSITVAVDELDAGVFEYLLGELLRIITEKGKGQLIFTSHNLRPLETIDRGFIAFTTTNPYHRYIRMTNVKDNNNLRSFYYRDIMLGEQDEELYKPTHNAEIAFALREAGEYSGS